MSLTNFEINGKTYPVSTEGSPEFKFGDDKVLSGPNTDIVYHLPWYKAGHTSENFLNSDEFASLKAGMTRCVKKITEDTLEINTDGFTLETYHKYVKESQDHYKVVARTRDLFPSDFNFPIEEIYPKFEKLLGFNLSDIDPRNGEKLHIIVRINRPKSTDYNPPHKDIYEELDQNDYIPPFVNLWIPIAGVTADSSLPIVPGSHHIPEGQILRTFDGGVVQGNKYRVRMIKEWGASTTLDRAEVTYGQVLFFSSHLIHGLAVNEEDDLTRVALEFRLFKV